VKYIRGVPVSNLGQFIGHDDRSFFVILDILNYTFTITQFYFVEF